MTVAVSCWTVASISHAFAGGLWSFGAARAVHGFTGLVGAAWLSMWAAISRREDIRALPAPFTGRTSGPPLRGPQPPVPPR